MALRRSPAGQRPASLLKTEKFQQAPIELPTLSACETAEGNDRAPLGISGAAIKARGQERRRYLWPVEDNAAKALMRDFTRDRSRGNDQGRGLCRAQLACRNLWSFGIPSVLAPLSLIGNWRNEGARNFAFAERSSGKNGRRWPFDVCLRGHSTRLPFRFNCSLPWSALCVAPCRSQWQDCRPGEHPTSFGSTVGIAVPRLLVHPWEP